MSLQVETVSGSTEHSPQVAVPFLTPAHKVRATDVKGYARCYFVQGSILSQMAYFEAHMARWKEGDHLELRLPQHCTHLAFEAILVRLLSSPKPSWWHLRWCQAIGNSLPVAVGVTILARMLLVNWIAEEIASVVHALTQTQDQAVWVDMVSRENDLSELRSVEVDGSMPEMKSADMEAMLHSAANGHQTGRDFARDLIRWRYERGHATEDAALLIDLFHDAGTIVGSKLLYGSCPLEVFNWMWELISECALPHVSNFNAIVEAFKPVRSLTGDYFVNRHGHITASVRSLERGVRMRIQEAFMQLLRAGMQFHHHEASADADLIAALHLSFGGNSCESGSTNLLRFSDILENYPDLLPQLLSDGLLDVGEPLAEQVIDALGVNCKNEFWKVLSPKLIASFTEKLQLKCLELCNISSLDLARLDVLRGCARARARSRLACIVGELNVERLDFVRGKRPRLTSGNPVEKQAE